MSEIPDQNGHEGELAPAGVETGTKVESEDGWEELESDRIKRRLGAAIAIPLASLILLVVIVLVVAEALIESSHLNAVAAPAVAGLAAVGIIVLAARGGLQREPRLSFGQVTLGILGVGVVLLGGAALLFSINSDQNADLPAGTVGVVASEFEFEASSWTVPEGEVTFNFESAGKIGHTLTIEGREDDLLLRVSPASASVSGSISLDEGTYTVYCDIKGHRELGMEAELVVSHSEEAIQSEETP